MNKECGRVVVALEQRFERTPDGRVWAPGSFGVDFWRRYLGVFTGVTIIARIREVVMASPAFEVCEAGALRFVGIRDYEGARGFLSTLAAIDKAAVAHISDESSVILRIPSPLGSRVAKRLARAGKPYGVEVVGDSHDVFAPGVFDHKLRPFVRLVCTRMQKRVCQAASAAAYVTEHTLQERYPCAGYSVAVSDVAIENPSSNTVSYGTQTSNTVTWRVRYPRSEKLRSAPSFSIVAVATLAQMYKGVDVLIDALALLIKFTKDIKLVVIGDGRFRDDLMRRAASRYVSDHVCFAGTLGRVDVVAQLDAADLFVLPSRTEGLPRSLIEAMARGLPCIASSVGGIPELLHAEDLCPPGDSVALADKIKAVMLDPTRRKEMSRRNLANTEAFTNANVRHRRDMFYRTVEAATAAWLSGGKHQ